MRTLCYIACFDEFNLKKRGGSIDNLPEFMQRNKSTISRYINGVPENGELIADSVVAFFLQQLSTVVKIGKKIFSKKLRFVTKCQNGLFIFGE